MDIVNFVIYPHI